MGIGCSGLLAVSLIVAAGMEGGRSPAERAATSLVMPVAMLWLFCFSAAITSWLLRSRRLALLFVLIWLTISVTFNGSVAGKFLQSMELPFESDPLSSLESNLDAVVLLGGYAGDNRFGVPELNSVGQRFLLAAQLWHAGKTSTLICTGTGTSGGRDPSVLARELLLSVGVPNQVIFEVPGVNTAAEMAALESFLENPPKEWIERIGHAKTPIETGFAPPVTKIGLVTTAVHLSRAARLAEQRGLEFVPLGCCFQGKPSAGLWARDLIPSAGAGRTFAIALKEWLAELVGR